MKKRIITIFSLLVCFLLLPQNSLSQGNPSYEVSIVKAVTNTKILPTTYPITSIGNEINITASPGEYEPASFVVHALQGITGMQASPTNLTSGANTIPASAVDIRYVKVWYQAGEGIEENNKRILKPELLLKDPNLVRVDLSTQKNYLRQPDGNYICISDTTTDLSNLQPQDEATLQPVDISANRNQQYWITIKVPDGTPAGTYQGTISLAASGVGGTNIPIKVAVTPFTLEKSDLIYSIYYLSQLTYYSWDHVNDNDLSYAWRSSSRYLAEMKNLKEHGILYPRLGTRNTTVADAELELRSQAGLPMSGPLFTIGIDPLGGNAIPKTAEELNELKTRVRTWDTLAKQHGFSDTYIYGSDEAHDPELTTERPAFQAVHDAGGKTYVSVCDYCSLSNDWGEPAQYEAFRIIGDLLDVAIEGFAPQSSISQEYHSIGHKVFSYGNPQCGVEEPEIYRRNYGLTLWKAGYDGAMDCCYIMNYGPSTWNDFDTPVEHGTYRDHVMAYPTMNGVIDTIQWEGWREGVDDTRYLATLQKAISTSSNAALKTEAQNWLNSLDTSGDLDAKRATMTDYITRLSATYSAADINRDESVNLADFSLLKADFLKLAASLTNPRSDINGDGQATIKDVGILMNGWRN